MTKTVTISATRADATPYGNHEVIVTLVAGSAGGTVGSNVVVESSAVRLAANGTGSIVLATNDVEVTDPAESFYRFTVKGSSPTITRSIALTDDLPSTVSWTRGDIQVADPVSPERSISSNYVAVPAGTMPVVEGIAPPATPSLTNNLAAINSAFAALGGNLAGLASGLTDEINARGAADQDLAVKPHAAVGLPAGNWLLVCHPNGVASSYSTPDFGPFTTGLDYRARVAAVAPNPDTVGTDNVSFLEAGTQIRQAPGGWGSDQDNLEAALMVDQDSVGLFAEHCKTTTPAPVELGEYAAGRLNSLTDAEADDLFRLGLGEAITWRWTYEFNVAGQWRQRFWHRAGEQDGDARTADGAWWRIVFEKIGTDGPGSIADAGMPFVIGLNPGVLAVEWVEWRDGLDGDLVGHFHTDDLQVDGTVESSEVSGQTWTPTGTPIHIDTTLIGLAETLAAGGGVALGETSSTAYRGDRGKTAYDHSQATTGNPHNVTAAQAGADPAGSAATAQAAAIQRANHTGTQAASTVTGLPWLDSATIIASARRPNTAATWSATTSPILGGGYATSGTTADQSWTYARLPLRAGTYALRYMRRKTSASGIVTMTLGAIAAGTYDGYAASNTGDVADETTGIVIPADGFYDLVLTNATKNASASANTMHPQIIDLRRTGA